MIFIVIPCLAGLSAGLTYAVYQYRSWCISSLANGRRLAALLERERIHFIERVKIAEVEGFYEGWAACSDEMRERDQTERRRAAAVQCPCPECVRRHLAAN